MLNKTHVNVLIKPEIPEMVFTYNVSLVLVSPVNIVSRVPSSCVAEIVICDTISYSIAVTVMEGAIAVFI